MEKEVRITLKSGQDKLTIKQALDSQKEISNSKLKMSIEKPSIEVHRFLRGKIAAFSNTLVTTIKNSAQIEQNIILTAAFDSHQYAFLSGIKIVDSIGLEKQDWTSRYLNRIPKPNGNLDISLIEIKLAVLPGEQLEVQVPFLINMRKVSEYEQEYERGTYMLGSILVSDDGDSIKTLALPPIQTNEKQIDSTFAFTTLTINNVIFFIVPITLMYFGINTK